MSRPTGRRARRAARLAALLAALPLAALPALAQEAGAAAGIPAGCTYLTCALRVEPGWGERLVRGAAGETVSGLGGFGGGVNVLLAGPDSAAHYARRYRPAKAWTTGLGVVAFGTWVAAALRARDAKDDEGAADHARTLAFVSTGLTLVAVPFNIRARRSLARSIWWYNAAIPR